MITRPHQIIALFGGLGLPTRGPGTWGTLGAFPLFWLLSTMPLSAKAAAYVGLLAVGTWAIVKTGRDLNAHDHRSIVIDEVIAMSLLLEIAVASWPSWILAFILFRIFDIAKPWPVYIPDRSPNGGFMVIADDLLAALWAAIVYVPVAWLLGWY